MKVPNEPIKEDSPKTIETADNQKIFRDTTQHSHSVLSNARLPKPSSPLNALQKTKLAKSIENISEISRSFQGIGDTSTSVLKQDLLLSGSELQEKVRENFSEAIELLLHFYSNEQLNPLEIAETFEQCVSILNHQIVVPQQGIWRTWSTGIAQHTPIDQIDNVMQDFYINFAGQHQKLQSDPIAFAAWVEQRLNIEIHPFSDGCGRTSKAFACAFLLKNEIAYPSFQNRDDYFRNAVKPLAEWTAEYRKRIKD